MKEQIQNFAQWVRNKRESEQLTQGQLAELAGCTRVTVNYIELDKTTPTFEMQQKIANALGYNLTVIPAEMYAEEQCTQE